MKYFLGIIALTFSLYVGATTKILFLGDSLTEGYGIQKSSSYPNLISEILNKEIKDNYIIINAGESGSKTSSALRRFRWHLRSKPQIIVLALGANDGLRGVKVAVMKKNLQQLIDQAKKNSIQVLLVGMHLPINYGKQYREEFYGIFPELAKSNKLALVPFLLEGVAKIKKYNLEDGIHPNENGHKIIAQTVLKHLRKLL